MSKKQLLSSNHNACAGCGQIIAAKTVINALGSEIIIINATGCLEVTTTLYPNSAWNVPWIHSLFENTPAVASGVKAGLKVKDDQKTKVVVQAGDGATFDIGYGALSGMWERGEEIIYICYDTEAYSNTGMQSSGATPWGSYTKTTPQGKKHRKKDLISLALAHKVPYVAQATAGYLLDIKNKIEKAKKIKGPSYIQILTPCIPGWKIKINQAIETGKLASDSGLYPLLEFENGKNISNFKIPKPKIKIQEYLKIQGRFSNLSKKDINYIQSVANFNIKRYNL